MPCFLKNTDRVKKNILCVEIDHFGNYLAQSVHTGGDCNNGQCTEEWQEAPTDPQPTKPPKDHCQ